MQDLTSSTIVCPSLARTALQTADILVIGLVAGATFGIWQGYNPAGYSAATFLEMHQGAVRGLNTLLPVLGAVSIALTLVLALMARANRRLWPLYALALVLMATAGLITRFGNQPINAQVMDWTLTTMPGTWAGLRDSWWGLHIMRTLASLAAFLVLIVAVSAERRSRAA